MARIHVVTTVMTLLGYVLGLFVVIALGLGNSLGSVAVVLAGGAVFGAIGALIGAGL